MSVFAWWEWIALIALVCLAWFIGYSSGEYYGRANAARAAAEKVLETLERIASKQNSAADKLNTVCDMFRQTVIALDKVGKKLGGSG